MNDQKKKYASKINIHTVKVGAGNSAEEIKKAQLATHGIVAKDKAGKLVAKVDGHNYGKEKVAEVIGKILTTKKK